MTAWAKRLRAFSLHVLGFTIIEGDMSGG